jgi:hypothetical protein
MIDLTCSCPWSTLAHAPNASPSGRVPMNAPLQCPGTGGRRYGTGGHHDTDPGQPAPTCDFDKPPRAITAKSPSHPASSAARLMIEATFTLLLRGKARPCQGPR